MSKKVKNIKPFPGWTHLGCPVCREVQQSPERGENNILCSHAGSSESGKPAARMLPVTVSVRAPSGA